MLLFPNADFGKPFPVNMAGLILEQNRGDDYFVRHVIKRSPAAKKGVKAGDVMTAIDGREIELTIDRSGWVIQKTLKLRRLI